MRTATPKTFAQNNKGFEIEISNWGTTSWVNFLQVLYKGGAISYEQFLKGRKVVYTAALATELVNANSHLFPIQF